MTIEKKTITLPVSGKFIEIDNRELTGRDREEADMLRESSGGSQTTWFHALLSRVLAFVSTDGVRTPLVKEDLDTMSTRDIDAITEAMAGDPRFFAEKKKGAK